MDLHYSEDQIAFRYEVRQFLKENLPADISNKVKTGKHLTKADHETWHAALNRQGWLANHWPKEYGGPGWNAFQKHIFEEELCAAGGPRVVPFGLNMLGPVLIKFGSEAQKKHYLPRILDGTDWWSQGYSEPGAGSDLASVKTRAVRDGDSYVVNGQKTWTTQCQHANWIFCLVRTNTQVKPQAGISFLLIDMKSPGVTVRPIITLDGEHEVNEVFFDDVRVPAENLVGEEDKGWTYAKYLLTYERTGLAGVGFATAALNRLKHIAKQEKKNGRPLAEDALFAARLAQVEIDLLAMGITNLRVISAISGGGVPGAESSMLKLKGTQIRQEISDLTRRALGSYALPFIAEALDADYQGESVGPDYAASVSPTYFNSRKLSIFGGSNEIQRNIISKMIIGL